MANVGDGVVAVNPSNLAGLLDNVEINRRVNALRNLRGADARVVTDTTSDIPDNFDYNSLLGVMLTAINGSKDVEEQTVQVQFLNENQKLVLPAALGMDPFVDDNSEADNVAELRTRYKKMATMTYAQIVSSVNANETAAQKRARVDERTDLLLAGTPPNWMAANYYRQTPQQQVDDSLEHISAYFASFSRTMRLNCDVRDFGKLVTMADRLRVSDIKWNEPLDENEARLKSVLMPYTLDSIAALNYAAVNNWGVGAWVRAFGVGCGVLPDIDTELTKEWTYTVKPADQGILRRMHNMHDFVGPNILSLCLNILSMFGLFHLSKNHTYKTGDDNMTRICTSFANTLRTMTKEDVQTEIVNRLEEVCRTVTHPFGLGQTYWLARLMNKHHKLSSPLQVRADVTPPLTQRLMIVQAATIEWKTLPVGMFLNQAFEESLEMIRLEIEAIRKCPPAYSELVRYYGLAEMTEISEAAKKAADALMPIVYGYAKALHTKDDGQKDGIALAMSFTNVIRDCRAATELYASLWDGYVNGLDRGGLERYVRSTYDLGGAEAGGR